MDKVIIEGLRIQTTIGFFEWEKQIKQTLVIDLALGWDISKAALNDALDETLDYAKISQDVEAFANANPVDLIETLAERLAQYLMSTYHLPWLKLKIGKPGAVHNTKTVAVEIERGSLS